MDDRQQILFDIRQKIIQGQLISLSKALRAVDTIASIREVQGTNDSSIVSKCSMARVGYFEDVYLQEFVSKVARRAPLINRGYYIRVKTIDYLYKEFLRTATGHKQIISLGAGFDSAYFRLKAEGELENVSFFEVDFPEVVKRKSAVIQTKDVLKNLIPDLEKQPTKKNPLIEILTDSYTLLGVDLTQLNTLEALLMHCGADVDTPTLLLSECVLTYMTRRCSSAVIHWAAETFSNAVFILYEQIYPDDAFGLFMQRHFQVIGSPLKCINSFPSLQSQVDRFMKQGWKKTEAMDMNQFYNYLVSKKERHIVENMEPFDEYEEWNLKCSHYMVLCGYSGDSKHLLHGIQQSSSKHADELENQDLQSVCFRSVSTSSSLLRFGHSSTCFHGNKCLLTVGGFGEQSGKHCRLIDIAVTDLETMETTIILPKVDPKILEVNRMHHGMCTLSDNTVFLIGGRTSPIKLCSQILKLQLSKMNSKLPSNEASQLDTCSSAKSENFDQPSVESHVLQMEKNDFDSNKDNLPAFQNSENCDEKTSSVFKMCEYVCDKHEQRSAIRKDETMEENCCHKHSDQSVIATDLKQKLEEGAIQNEGNTLMVDQWNVRFSIVTQSGDIPCPRWRHTVTLVQIQGMEQVLVYGGRTDQHLALADAYLLHVQTGVWTKVITADNVPGSRQAHSSTSNGQVVFVSGGLDLDLQPLKSICTYNPVNNAWEEFPLKGKVFERYSHTSHVVGDYLILIGGVNHHHSPPGVAVIHIPSHQCLEFPLPEQKKERLVMLHRHSSTYLGHNQFLIIGGGGNCFSFGTHLNVTPLILDLSKCLQQATKHFSHQIKN